MTLEFPGLFDLQVNGFGGIDFNAPDLTTDRVSEALDRMRHTGVTRCLPTLITSSFEQFARSARVIARTSSEAIAGIHMEGPYLSPDDGTRGAHPRAFVVPASIDDFNRRQDAAGGSDRAGHARTGGTRRLGSHRAPGRVGRARCDRPYGGDRARNRNSCAAGATLATHLGNGCAHMLPRHPNAIWELLAADAILMSLIVDGHHLPASTVKAMVRAKGPRRTILVTDAIAAAGSGPGAYTIGDVICELGVDGRVSLPGTPYLAGSALTLDRAIAHTVRFTSLPIEDVIPMASSIPAAYLGATTRGTVRATFDEPTGELTIESVCL